MNLVIFIALIVLLIQNNCQLGATTTDNHQHDDLLLPTNNDATISNAMRSKSSSSSSIINNKQTTSGWLANFLQVPKDEFNTTENPIQFLPMDLREDSANGRQLITLRQILLKSTYQDCCLPWINLTTNLEIQEEIRRKMSNVKGKQTVFMLKASDLLNELKQTFSNITYLSIDGQPGGNEREKYYNFYDGVQYYLRLMKVARNYLSESTQEGSSLEAEFNRIFKRQVKSIEFKVSRDPTLSNFINELLNANGGNGGGGELINENFQFYEEFLGFTQFGQYYAKNISMIRESVMVFDQICNHINSLNFPSNLTRISVQYEMIRRMSFELYYIRNELIQKINSRIRNNRPDVRHVFRKLNDLVETKPYVRLLGDEFSSSPPNFGEHVKQLTKLLDLYTANSLTEASFYKQLAELPEEFILFGSSIAHEYEIKEVPQYNKFESNYIASWSDHTNEESNSTSSETNDARRSNLSLLTRIFS